LRKKSYRDLLLNGKAQRIKELKLACSLTGLHNCVGKINGTLTTMSPAKKDKKIQALMQ
jgi:hypothetical protein